MPPDPPPDPTHIWSNNDNGNNDNRNTCNNNDHNNKGNDGKDEYRDTHRMIKSHLIHINTPTFVMSLWANINDDKTS